ncbi:MAG: ATP synthase gamma chain [Pirellulaceae bacterium]|nr:MAG: ATP synthase gamma chain [Pirellulaceae bacterium]
MAKARVLDKRRRSIRNIRKITRTMELIATARFKKAMDRATAATAYTQRITHVVRSLARAGQEVRHPLLVPHETEKHAKLLVLTANRGLCGGYNANVIRLALKRWSEWQEAGIARMTLEVSGKRGISAFKFRRMPIDERYTQFEDQPKFDQVDQLATRYLDEYALGTLDRLDVVYTKFINLSKQVTVVETLLPLAALDTPQEQAAEQPRVALEYEFLPSAESILAEVVPMSFKVKLFKCFLDAAVSEQIARMVAMKSATENAGQMIKMLSLAYNRARQTQITKEIMEVIGGAEALK